MTCGTAGLIQGGSVDEGESVFYLIRILLPMPSGEAKIFASAGSALVEQHESDRILCNRHHACHF